MHLCTGFTLTMPVTSRGSHQSGLTMGSVTANDRDSGPTPKVIASVGSTHHWGHQGCVGICRGTQSMMVICKPFRITTWWELVEICMTLLVSDLTTLHQKHSNFTEGTRQTSRASKIPQPNSVLEAVWLGGTCLSAWSTPNQPCQKGWMIREAKPEIWTRIKRQMSDTSKHYKEVPSPYLYLTEKHSHWPPGE